RAVGKCPISGFLDVGIEHLEPPINVTLQCRNMHNVLKWSYTQFPPGLRFRVNIAYHNFHYVHVKKTLAQLHADVSFLRDPKNAYYLDVTAVIGQNESAPEEGLSFSYFKDSPADHKCHLDFPSVNVTTQHDGAVLVRFTHPSLVYFHNLPSGPIKRTRKKKSHQELPGFRYDVVLIHQKGRHHSFHCETSVCQETISVDAAQKKHCLNMKGELEKISVQATQDYCVSPREDTPSYLIPIYVICGLSALSALCFVLYMVYRKQTSPNTPSPKSMLISKVVRETCFVPEVAPSSPTPLLSAEEKEFTAFVPCATEPELHLPIRPSSGDEGLCGDDEDGAMAEEPGYVQGQHLEEEESTSGYEKRLMLVELAPDELTEGYRGF
uniref:Fibronectin type-III domain-containing protein n=1 Tax=Cyclopterus lumpus TaxID=8103 RepID=A0A8C2ZRR4_CYCLU